MDATSEPHPTLWHLSLSHYSEKVRWALDHKRAPHTRRAALVPGTHMAAAMWLTRSATVTFPVLQLDGRSIADSTRIIAALEERFPEPPLYPADPDERRRALELEDFFDEELGPHIRLLAFHELGNDRERFEAVVRNTIPGPLGRNSAGAVAYARTFTGLRFGVRSEESAEVARGKIVAALDRLEAELGSSEHLAGERFSVADLTAAALFYPLVLPEEGPLPAEERPPEGMQRFRAPLEGRRGYRWVEETYRRHRKPALATA
ncbi:MAG TPA: glutathione S-transferase family protein [Solirubrobacterales bacterium]|nr:glutathione S-transferase family protein [Solirubrobacterales bacterium]